MSEGWSRQIRVYLREDPAEAAYRGDQSAVQPLTSQFRAFEDYVQGAERKGVESCPLYKWTKATVDDPEMRAKHIGASAIRVGGAEVFGKEAAALIETDLRPLVGGGLVTRMSKHDTDPAKNIPVPSRYRS